MAKMFYSAAEAAAKLGKTEDDLKGLVRDGKLREFRDAGTINYKVADVDKLAGDQGGDEPAAPAPSGSDAPAAEKSSAGASASGEIILEPVEEDSGIELAPAGSDILSLDDADAADTAAGTKGGTTATKKQKEGSSVPSVGVNVFDDDELDEQVDPLAQTAVSDIAGLGIEGVGSGSGIMELTRESDDTSLGQELLDEIYTDEEGKEKKKEDELGGSTRAGMEVAEEGPSDEDEPAEAALEGAPAVAARPRAATVEVVEYAPDAISSGLTALLAVAVAVMLVAGLGAAALARGITPALLQWLHGRLALFAGVSLGVGVLAAGVTYFLAKRSE